MATAWVRSLRLSCKSSAVADHVFRPPPNKLLPVVSCAATHAFLPAPAKDRPPRPRAKPARSSRHNRKKPKPKPAPSFITSPAAPVPVPAPAQPFLTMAELPEGHSSRRVVELIFASGWSASAAEVEALFGVHNTARAVARFEDARATARDRGKAARCAADGNEMMRFQCRAAAAGQVICAAVSTCRLGTVESAVRTFAGTGAAHSSAGAGAGRRAMLVCRVIAGRVRPANEPTLHVTDYDSVDLGGGELVVLDSRAVLPCFLIIYKVNTLDTTTNNHPR